MKCHTAKLRAATAKLRAATAKLRAATAKLRAATAKLPAATSPSFNEPKGECKEGHYSHYCWGVVIRSLGEICLSAEQYDIYVACVNQLSDEIAESLKNVIPISLHPRYRQKGFIDEPKHLA